MFYAEICLHMAIQLFLKTPSGQPAMSAAVSEWLCQVQQSNRCLVDTRPLRTQAECDSHTQLLPEQSNAARSLKRHRARVAGRPMSA
jgi:hypothetical protein